MRVTGCTRCPRAVAGSRYRLSLRNAGSSAATDGPTMKPFTWLVIIGVALFGFWHFRSRATPSAQDVEPALRAYLTRTLTSKCSGSMTFEQLDNLSVGDYAPESGGWPVYADHAETCHEHFGVTTSTTTYDGRGDAERHVAVAFVRRTVTGHVEVFLPDIFQAGERQMQQSLQKAVDGLQINGSR